MSLAEWEEASEPLVAGLLMQFWVLPMVAGGPTWLMFLVLLVETAVIVKVLSTVQRTIARITRMED